MDLPPPLEDMTEVVQNIKSKKINGEGDTILQGEAPVNSHINEQSIAVESNDKVPVEPVVNKKKKFGGMQKGFLFSKPSKSKVTKQKPSAGTFDIKPSETKEDTFVFKEVQDALNSDAMSSKNWMTDDLLNNINKNDILMKKLADPRFSQAVEWMKRDPKGAMEHYKDDSEVQMFFKEFYQILGNHFTNLEPKTKEEPKSIIKSEDDIKMEEIISKPEIRAILSKPGIQELFELLRNDPEEAQKMLQFGNPALAADIKILVSAGLLKFES